MDGVSLIREAHEAGLEVRANGDKLVIRGPRHAEPVVRKLIAHKAVVLAALAPAETELPDRPPPRPGYLCELARADGRWVWRFRRPDVADRVYWQWKRAGEG